mgnify:CR=1 FL=1
MKKLNSKSQAGTAADGSIAAEVKTSSPTCCNTLVGGSFSPGCDVNYVNPVYTFKDGECFKDDVYFGKVVFSDETMLQVEVDNGNKYMKGQINTFHRVLP